MMKQSDIQARLSIYRYAILSVAVTAFIVSLFTPVIFTANPNFGDLSLTIDDVFIPSLFVTSAALLVGIASYFVYAQLLKTAAKKRHTILIS